MSDNCFGVFSSFIQSRYGIKMPEVKKAMLESRLQKRLTALDMGSFEEYADYVFSPDGAKHELIHMIDRVTTNKTDFFREPAHFQYLTGQALPELIDGNGAGVKRPLRVWSAGCSTGEEPYTLAMVLSEFAEVQTDFEFSILGTDISLTVLEKALKGIYRKDLTEPVPHLMRKKYLMRSKDREHPLVRIAPGLRRSVLFRRLNLMDDDFGMKDQLDVIFCRNVIIYFDLPTQYDLMKKFCENLTEGGFLFIGHSETLNRMDLPLKQAAPMVYRKVDP